MERLLSEASQVPLNRVAAVRSLIRILGGQVGARHDQGGDEEEHLVLDDDPDGERDIPVRDVSAGKVGIAQSVRAMESLSDALVYLADHPSCMYGHASQLTDSLGRLTAEALRGACVPTLTLPVNPSGVYDDVHYITEFHPNYVALGGNARPKLLTCTDSAGCSHRMILKGVDDLRQDVALMQVCREVNKWLAADVSTRRRQLQLRTYNVVPLSPRTGLIQFVHHCVPILDYLLGNGGNRGAVERYRLCADGDYDDLEQYVCENWAFDIQVQERVNFFQFVSSVRIAWCGCFVRETGLGSSL